MSFPCRSVTMRGSAVPTTVWSSAARKRPSMTATTISIRVRGSINTVGRAVPDAIVVPPAGICLWNNSRELTIHEMRRKRCTLLDVFQFAPKRFRLAPKWRSAMHVSTPAELKYLRGELRLALHAAHADALDEVALEGEEHDDHRDRGDRRARHQHAEVRIEFPLQGREPDLHRVFRGIAQDDEREDERVPVAVEGEDREHRECGLRQRQDDARVDLPFGCAVEARGVLQFTGQRLDELLHEEHAEDVRKSG